jgi:hypothetical protein
LRRTLRPAHRPAIIPARLSCNDSLSSSVFTGVKTSALLFLIPKLNRGRGWANCQFAF